MYAVAGQNWYRAMNNYEVVEQALQQQQPVVALSHLGEAIVYMQRALELGRHTMPTTIRTAAKECLTRWYALFIELYQAI